MSAIRATANAAPPAPVSDPEKAARSAKLERAGREFEAIFVRTLLAKSPLASKGDAYADLAVGALAEAVTKGRGLGLGELVRSAVEKNEQALKDRR